VVYVESTRIEIPLAHAAVRGARGRFPVKLIYASVLPMILVRALQANIQMMGTIISTRLGHAVTNSAVVEGVRTTYTYYQSVIGTMAQTVKMDEATGAVIENTGIHPINGMIYYLSPIRSPSDWIPSLISSKFSSFGVPPPPDWQIGLHVMTDAFMLIVGGIIFALFWIETTGKGAKSVAEKIHRSGMQIPGYRRSSVTLERVMQRYIPKVTIIGGAFIGLLTLIASLLGTLGSTSGTGLLLTVSIMYRLYEDIASQQLMEMHPMMRTFFGKE